MQPTISSVLVKPTGADCNLACEYCFYRPKGALYPGEQHPRMSDEVLESMIRQYLEIAGPQAALGWQGGEPTLMGLDFYRRAIELQKAHGQPGQRISNGLQTNGLLLDREWARFLRDNRFLVGISIDGPEEMHDAYRRTPSGKPSHELVMNAIRQMKLYDVEFNALVVLSPANVRQPDKVYDYFLRNGIYYLQFIPIAEEDGQGGLAPFSITGQQFGDFLCGAFDRWLVNDQPTAYVRLFDEMLIRYVRGDFPSCTFRDSCDSYVVIEHNGDVYACDFFVTPGWYLGNLMETPLADIVSSEKRLAFAKRKRMLSEACEKCPWLTYCYGGCPKYREMAGGIRSLDIFCEGYKKFFEHSRPTYERLAERYRLPERNDEGALLPTMGAPVAPATVGRNDPCPCGSGKKYKNCCGRRR